MRLTQNNPEQLNDSQLVASCLEGDQAAWNELVNRYSRLVYSIAFRSGIDANDVDDVVQNVFVTVLRKLESLRERDRFSSWLITTAKRESWHHKSGKKEIQIEDDAEFADQSTSAEDSMIAWEEAYITSRAMDRLGERCKYLLSAIFLADNRPSYQEIGTELGIAMGSIGPIRARCLKQLRTHLSDMGFRYET